MYYRTYLDEVIYMRKRKRVKKFNTIIIKKNDLLCITSVILFIAFCSFFASKINFTKQAFEKILNIEIPVLKSSASLDVFYKNNQLSIFNPGYILMDTIHTLSKDALPSLKSNEKDESKNINVNVDDVHMSLPKNTFPIKALNVKGKNLETKNETTYLPDIYSLLYSSLEFKKPEILIVHTHGSESYKMDDFNHYTEGDPDRTIDINYNVVRVGNELEKELTKYGFKVTHAEDINDYPSYNQSYNKTLQVIEYHLKKNKNIQIVLDIHRDSIIRNDGSKIKFLSEINGEKVAQIMIVCGTNQAGLENDSWQENLKFAIKMQNYMENKFPGFARPLNLRQERFNTHATHGSMIIEVGASGNTLNEALSSVKYIAETINEVLLPYK